MKKETNRIHFGRTEFLQNFTFKMRVFANMTESAEPLVITKPKRSNTVYRFSLINFPEV